MSKSAKASFLKGAIIIAFANILVKVIGAAFKIPLARFVLGPDGMGIYNTAYTVYNWLFVISTAGLPVAISKMVSESIAERNYEEAKKIFRVSRYFLTLVGLSFTLILLIWARPFADFFKSPSAYYSILAMAPSLFFVGLMSSYRGYFQGMQNMIPTAASQIFEALGKLVIGLFLGLYFLPLGKEYASAGAIIGVSSGTIFGVFVLILCYFRYKKRSLSLIHAQNRQNTLPARRILKNLIWIAVPITLGTSVFTLTNMIDVYMIKERLMSLGWSEMLRETWYGYYSGYAVTMFNLPLTVVIALGISVVPAIASALAVYNQKNAQKLTESVLRVTVLFSVPCSIGLIFFAGPILNLLYADTNATTLLQILGLSAVTMSLVTISNSILQAAGKMWLPVVNSVIGCVFKIIINFILVGIPSVNINGAPIATNVCYLVIVVLNLIAVKRILKVHYKVGEFLVRPLVSGLLMGIATAFLHDYLVNYIGGFFALLLTIIAAMMLYILALLLVKGLKREDLSMVVQGKNLDFLLDKFKILK